ncbi:MAG: hypothetical protein OWV35_01090, partial [Firmicutes bacterium]|nr:hypothetical protein [Bacillota bacterium]
MSSGIGPDLLHVLAVILTGGAIKLADDEADTVPDAAAGRPNLVLLAGGRGLTAYAGMALALAGRLDAGWTLGLFAAAYAAGMFAHPRDRLPSGLAAWQESALVLAGTAWLVRGVLAAALAVVLAVQWVDNEVDGRDG